MRTYFLLRVYDVCTRAIVYTEQPVMGTRPCVCVCVSCRIPLLELRGCHGVARICYAAPYGASSEQGREFLRDAKTGAALLGGIDALVALLKRTNRRYQDLVRLIYTHTHTHTHMPQHGSSQASDGRCTWGT